MKQSNVCQLFSNCCEAASDPLVLNLRGSPEADVCQKGLGLGEEGVSIGFEGWLHPRRQASMGATRDSWGGLVNVETPKFCFLLVTKESCCTRTELFQEFLLHH